MKRRFLSLVLAVLMCAPEIFISISATEEDDSMQVQSTSAIIPGDVDGNGMLSEDDLIMLSKHVAKISEITNDEYLNNADVNGDGEINAEDITALTSKLDLDNRFRIVETTVNKENAMVGSTFEWSAYALGGDGRIEYSFELRKVDNAATYSTASDEFIFASQDYSTENRFSVTINEAGTYSVTIHCMDERGTECSLKDILPVTVTNTDFDGITIKADKIKYACVSDSIEWNVDTIGGNAPFTYEYKLYYNNRKIDSIISSDPSYSIESCEIGEYKLFVECTDVDGLCMIEYSDILTVVESDAFYPEAPVVWVDGDEIVLSDTVAEAKKNESKSVTLLWNSVPSAKEYGLELCYYAAGKWISVHEAHSIDNTSYTLPYSVLKSAITEKLYRIGIFSKGIAEGEIKYYYFYMTPTTADKSIVVDEGQVSAWDLAAVNSVTRYFNVSSELDYTVSSDVEWIKCVKGTDGFVATVLENSERVSSRTGFITIDNSENSVTIQVNQGNGKGAPILLYPYLSSDSTKPTERPVGGITLEFEEDYANYIGVRIYELSAGDSKTVVYENIVSNDTSFLHITEQDCDKKFIAGKKYLLELSGRYSTSYKDNEVEDDVEKALFYVEMLADGHKILVEGTDFYEITTFDDVTVDLFSTNAWTYTTDAEWIHVEEYQSVSFNKDIERVKIVLEPNYSNEARDGYVTFFCGDKQAVAKLTQKGWTPRFTYPDVSKDMNNPTVFPASGAVFGMVAKSATYAVYSNGSWSEEKIWSDSDTVEEKPSFITDEYFEKNVLCYDVLYRFTLQTDEQTNIYYLKFSSSKTQKYIVLYENYDDKISVEWDFPSVETERSIKIKTNDSWAASSDVSWLTLSKTSGDAQTTGLNVTVFAEPNYTGGKRTGVLKFKIGSTVYATLTVTQSVTDYLELFAEDKEDTSDYIYYNDKTSFKNCDGSGDSLRLSAWTNGKWGAISNNSWITFSGKNTITDKSSGSEITIKLEENSENSYRTGSITVYSGNQSKTVTITQAPCLADPILISPVLSTSSKNPSTILFGDIYLTWNAVERAEYYEVVVKPADESVLLPNSNFYSYINVINDDGSDAYSCVIPQEALSLNADSYDRIQIFAYDAHGYYSYSTFYFMPTSGDVARIKGTTTPVWDNATDIPVSQGFIVTSTANWNARSNSPWITIDRTSGSNGDTLTVSLEQNYGDARTGYVSITVGTSETVLTVNQCAYLPMFPSFDDSMFSGDKGHPTVISPGTSSIRVVWNYEPQAEGYELRIGKFKSNSVESIIAKANCDGKGEYTFTGLELIPGVRYSISISRHSHWGLTSRRCYFMINDENAYVEVNGKDNIDEEFDADEDTTHVTVTGSGMWIATVSDDWLLVDNEPITQSYLDEYDRTTADFASYSGVSGDKLYISALANPGNTYRYGTVTVKCSGAEATITITQEPYYDIAKIYSPVMLNRRQDSVGLPYGDVTVRWSPCVGGEGTYQLILEEREEDSTYKYYDILEVSDIKQNSYTIPVKKLKEGGYYCLTLCSDLVGVDKEDSPCQRYYFYIKYENELSVSADVEWDIENKMVKISASASGGAGEYLYSYELLCNGEVISRSDLWDWKYYTFPITENGNYQVVVYCCDDSGASDEFSSAPYEASDSVTDLVSISPNRFLLGTAGGNVSVVITSNDTWLIESYPSWVTCSALEGNNGDKITISVKTNLSTERNGTIVFVSGAARASLSISQESAVLAPVITYPLSGSVLDIGDISIKWKQVLEADSYLVSIRDITTDVLLTHHAPVTGCEYAIARSNLTNGHEYRIAVGAIVDNQTWWTESTFSISVPETSDDSVTDDEVVNHNYVRITTGTKLINQNLIYHDVVTTYYEKCTICGDTTSQKTDTVSVDHNFTYCSYELAHPHAKFQRCACGSVQYIEGGFQTGNGHVQEENICCICHGHSYDKANPKEVNGRWKAYCTKCGNYTNVEAPTANNPAACAHPNGFNMERKGQLETTYVNANDKYVHTASSLSYTVMCCSQCGIEDNLRMYTLNSNSEPHTFNEDAVCMSCGFVSDEGIYDCTKRYELVIRSKYYVDTGDDFCCYIGINEPLAIHVYDRATGQTYLASGIDDVSLILKDPDGIASIDNGMLCASNSGTCEVVLSYCGKQIDSIVIGATVLSVEDTFWSYRIISSGVVRIEDLNRVSWSDANVLITPWAAMGNYVAKQKSDGSYTISFDVYNTSAEILGFAVFDDAGKRINDDVVLIEPYWGTGSFAEGVWKTFSETVRVFDSKSFDTNCEVTNITLNVPEGGYVSIMDPTSDLKVFSANLGQLLIGALKTGGTVKSLVFPDVDVKALAGALEKEKITKIIYDYLENKYNNSIDVLVSNYLEKHNDRITYQLFLETEFKGTLWEDIIESVPTEILKTIAGKIEDVALMSLNAACYYAKHLTQFVHDSVGLTQLEVAFYKSFHDTNTVYVDAIITPHLNYNAIVADNFMIQNNASTMVYAAAQANSSSESLNVTATVPSEANVGDKVTIILSNKDMTVSSYTCGIQYDKSKLSLVSITGTNETDVAIDITRASDDASWNALVYSTLDEAKVNGNVGFAFAGSQNETYSAGSFAKITFEVIEQGTAEIIVYEDSAGNDGVINSCTQEVECHNVNDSVTKLLELTEESEYVVNESISTVIVKSSAKGGESLDVFMDNIAIDPKYVRVVDNEGTVLIAVKRLITGYKIQLLDENENISNEYTIVILGDTDRNGRFSLSDVSGVEIAAIAKLEKGSVEFLEADIDGNSRLSMSDASALEVFIVSGIWQ